MNKHKRSQNEHFTIKGHWWLPDIGRRVAGDLCYTEGGLKLNLYGGLNDAVVENPFSAKPNTTEFPLIYGESEDNTQFSLLEAFYTKFTPDITTRAVRPGERVGIRSSQLHCHAVIDGVHLLSPDEAFVKCRLEIPHIDVWLGVTPFKCDLNDKSRHVSLKYKPPKDETYKLKNSACQVGIVHAVTPPGLPHGPSPTIAHQTFLDIAPSEPKLLKQLLALSSDIVAFLSIAYGGPLQSIRTMLYLPSNDQPLPVFYSRHEVRDKSYDPHDFVLPYKAIDSEFPKILDNWMSANTNLRRARQMLISSERRPSAFIELRFLPLAHAVEVLSNEASITTMIDPKEFKKVRNKMLDAVSDDVSDELVKSIKDSLQWANGRSLKEKLRSLLGELRNETWQLFAADKEKFLTGIVKTRNHYTHYSTKPGQKFLQEVELHWGSQKLALMIRVLLLMRAGVQENVLQKAIRSHVRLSQERRVWREITEEGSEYSSDEEY